MPGTPALAMNGHHRTLPREVLQIPPFQPAGLRYAGARVIEELQQGLVAPALGRGRPGRMEQIQSIPFERIRSASRSACGKGLIAAPTLNCK